MRKIVLSEGETLTNADLKRTGALPKAVMESAQAIVDEVRERGDAAVRDFCLKFDGACPKSFRVPDEAVKGALEKVDPRFVEAVKRSYAQVREFHEHEREDSWFETRPDGTILGSRRCPLLPSTFREDAPSIPLPSSWTRSRQRSQASSVSSC